MTLTDNHRFQPNRHASGWSEERTELLKKLWADGISGSDIAARLGGITRNAVIGKVHRLGLSGRATTSRAPYPRSRESMASKAARKWNGQTSSPSPLSLIAAAPDPLPPRQETDIARVSFNDLENSHCRFIPDDAIGKAAHEPLYCGLEKVAGMSYCRAHALRCYDLTKVGNRHLPKPNPHEGAFDRTRAIDELEGAVSA